MSRKRLSWLKKSDPYTMNQEREDPAADDYWIGGPSEFAETPHPELPDDPELGRNEVGHPNMSERNLDSKNVDEWGADDGRPYDNQPYWPDEGPTAGLDSSGDYWNDSTRSASRQKRHPEKNKSRQRQSARNMYSRLKKKAFQCVKIASAILPSATESVIEEQAFELMALPDDVVVSTAIRLSDEEEDDKKKDDKKKKKDDDGKKEADLMLQEMLQEERMAEGDDDDDDDDEKKEKKEDYDEDDNGDDGDDEKESAGSEDVDQMLNDMMGGDDARRSEQGTQPQQPAPAPQPSQGTDFGIELEPTMNAVSTEDANANLEQNDVLQQIWGESIPEGAKDNDQETVNSVADRSASQQGTRRQAAHSHKNATANKQSQGVQTLGGGVKQSNNGGDDEFDLSKLWDHAPDVSDVMNE